MNNDYVLEMNGITKDYSGNIVLNNIDLKVKPGEIHALLGENGAGKSTLMNILFGMPVIHSTGGFKGEVRLNGEIVNIISPKEAMEQGIGMVHQEFMLIPGFTIAENIKLNREITRRNIISSVFNSKALEFLDGDAMSKDSRKALDTLNIGIDENAYVSSLPVGYMQLVEIAREIDKKNIKLLVFDEPTAVLTESEAENLIGAMKVIAGHGIAILFITHRLDEVMMAADTVTVLRDGNLVVSKPKAETNVMEIAALMVGRELSITKSVKTEEKEADIVMSLRDLHVKMPGEAVKGVDLDIMRGEIIGIGGLAGQGKIGISNGIMGMFETEGEITINDEKLVLNNTIESYNRKLAFVSEDRKGVGLLLDSSIEDNIAITAIRVNGDFLKKFGPFSFRDDAKIKSHAESMIKELDIRCTGTNQETRRLSGGNQQKVCLARALTIEPEILLVSEPTRGVDIGAKQLILDKLRYLNKELGMTIIMTSSELAELRSICDRIVIVCEGKVEGVLKPDASDVDFGLMMSGDYKKVIVGGIA